MATQNQTSFIIESVALESERLEEIAELRAIVTDLEIFEHVEQPYLTGRMLILDDSNFYQEADIFGSEKITIKIKSTEKGAELIEKTFFIDKIEKQESIQDNAQVLLIHLVEDIFYISSLININRHYSGKPSAIIKRIAKQFLKKDVISSQAATPFAGVPDFIGGGITGSGFVDQQNIRCIIPNLHPIETLQWLTARASTTKGYPFYMYSTLVDKELILEDLGTILSKEALNVGRDAKFVQQSNKILSTDVATTRRSIKKYEMADGSENLLQIIRRGLVAADYEFIDTLTENTRKFKYDSKKDLFRKLLDDNILSAEQPNPNIHFDEVINDKTLDKSFSKYITKIGGSNAFRTQPKLGNIAWTNSYGETKTAAEYKMRVIQASMDTIVKKNPVNITVDGQEFIKGDFSKTIGNNIDVVFLSTLNSQKGEDGIDKKKSGKYTIYSARHMFKKTVQTYDVALGLIKIGNMKK